MYLLVKHRVRDFDAWKPLFDEHQSARERHGAVGHWLSRSSEDPNKLLVGVEFATAEGAHAFLADPSLKETMARAGVEGEPSITFWDAVEAVQYAQVPA